MSWAKRSKSRAARAKDTARCQNENDVNNTGSKPLFTRPTKNPATTKDRSNFDANEFDYIVEKLVVKRVPVGLFATRGDVYKDTEGDDSRNICSIVPPLLNSSSIIYTSTNEPGVSGFGTRGTSKHVLHLTNNNDATFGREEDPIARSLGRFTALHPNLKASERPPKDPLNITKSRRSLAEELSEIAAKREIPNDSIYERRNEILTTESVHTARSGSLQKFATEQNVTEEKSSSNREKSVNSSCFPFGWKTTAESRVAEENNSDDNEESFGPSKNQNFTIAPIQVNYHKASSDLKNVPKNKNANRRFGVRTIDGNPREVFAESEPRIDDLAGTMLRWKIIIKHRPPTSPAKISDTIPQLGKSLRNPIEAKIYKESRKNKNN